MEVKKKQETVSWNTFFETGNNPHRSKRIKGNVEKLPDKKVLEMEA